MGQRIDGWAAIAAYLRVSRNTAMGMAADLPHHRMGRALVYAFACELDAYVRSRPSARRQRVAAAA